MGKNPSTQQAQIGYKNIPETLLQQLGNMIVMLSQLTFTFANSTMEIPEQSMYKACSKVTIKTPKRR